MVRTGTLGMHYNGIPSGLLEDPAAAGLDVYAARGGSRYSLRLNPAEGDAFDPFQIREVRFAVNYLMDGQVVVDELLGGSG